VFSFLLPTHMSQEEKKITETLKKQLLSAFSREKSFKKHTKMINIFGFSFFSNEQSQLVEFFNVTARGFAVQCSIRVTLQKVETKRTITHTEDGNHEQRRRCINQYWIYIYCCYFFYIEFKTSFLSFFSEMVIHRKRI